LNLCIIGAGHVGLATAAAFANLGHDVICADTDADKIALLNAGECRIREPILPEVLRRNLVAGRLSFTTDTSAAVRSSEIIFIAVGTPLDADNRADLSHLHAAALDIARGPGAGPSTFPVASLGVNETPALPGPPLRILRSNVV